MPRPGSIRTSHTGSLPRPQHLVDLLRRNDHDRLDEQEKASFPDAVRQAVFDVVRQQVEIGIDIVNDGEMGKIAYSTYPKERLTGFTGPESKRTHATDVAAFPSFEQQQRSSGSFRTAMPSCVGDITYIGRAAANQDIQNLRDALAAVEKRPDEAFMTAASPGVISLFFTNHHYPSRTDYLFALADAMKQEYELIAAAGFTLQIDCPDLAMSRHLRFGNEPIEQFREHVRENIAALNHAVADIPADQMRMHLCWGNYEGPHHHDVPLADILDLVLTAKPATISFEAANPRHAHEWRVFEQHELPAGKLIMPGVIDTCTNYIEHPDLVAQRLERFAAIVGPGRLIAATDCGLSSGAGSSRLDPDIAWAKLGSLVEGTRLANGAFVGQQGIRSA